MDGKRHGVGDRRLDLSDVDELGRNDSLKAQNGQMPRLHPRCNTRYGGSRQDSKFHGMCSHGNKQRLLYGTSRKCHQPSEMAVCDLKSDYFTGLINVKMLRSARGYDQCPLAGIESRGLAWEAEIDV
jgi:hypothetical protein